MRFVKIPVILICQQCQIAVSYFVSGTENQRDLTNSIATFASILASSIHFDVCVTRKSHQRLRQEQQIYIAERAVLIRITRPTRVILIWEIRR